MKPENAKSGPDSSKLALGLIPPSREYRSPLRGIPAPGNMDNGTDGNRSR
jgi:hypothetical protein